MCSELQFKNKKGTCSFKDKLIMNSDLRNVTIKINKKPIVITEFPFSQLVPRIDTIEIEPRKEVSVSCFIEEDPNADQVSYKTITDHSYHSPKEPFRYQRKGGKHHHIFVYVYDKTKCQPSSGTVQQEADGICVKTNKCSHGYFRHLDRCVKMGDRCDEDSIMSSMGNCVSVDLSCPIPDEYTQFYSVSRKDGIKECVPTCHLVSEEGNVIVAKQNKCVKTKQCADGFTYHNGTCIKEGESCELGKTMKQGYCTEDKRVCTYNDPDTYERQNEDCSISCKIKTSDNFKITKTNYKTCTKTEECADGYMKHKDYCILSSFGKCAIDGTNVISKNGTCTESYVCPKPDHLHKSYSNNCIPTCHLDFQGFDIKYDYNKNSCIKQPHCIEGMILTNGVCKKQNTDCSHLRESLDPFSKQLNGQFVVTEKGCELQCDSYHPKTRTKTKYKFNSNEQKTQCFASETECHFDHETYLRSKRRCVTDIPITIINAGQSRILLKVVNDIRSIHVTLVPQERKTVYVPRDGNTYMDSETNVPVKLLFMEQNKITMKFEQYLRERLPLEKYSSGNIFLRLYTKTPEHHFKTAEEVTEKKQKVPHGIFTDYV